MIPLRFTELDSYHCQNLYVHKIISLRIRIWVAGKAIWFPARILWHLKINLIKNERLHVSKDLLFQNLYSFWRLVKFNFASHQYSIHIIQLLWFEHSKSGWQHFHKKPSGFTFMSVLSISNISFVAKIVSSVIIIYDGSITSQKDACARPFELIKDVSLYSIQIRRVTRWNVCEECNYILRNLLQRWKSNQDRLMYCLYKGIHRWQFIHFYEN